MFTNHDAAEREQERNQAPKPRLDASPTATSAPACHVCGRQDETLRVVAYPYVVSVILMTFRRAFSGVWCSRHRSQRLFLASAITALFGWFGFPFGLFWTPVTLFKLARGGEQPKDLNQRLLEDLAERKSEAGDELGALRCLEARLRLGDDAETKERVRHLRVRLGLPTPRPTLGRLAVSLPPALLGAFGVAVAALILDDLVRSLIRPLLLQMGGPVYALILSLAPGIALVFVGGLLLRRLTERTVVRLGSRGAFLSGGIGVLLSLFAIYGLLEGYTLSYFVTRLLIGSDYTSVSEAVRSTLDSVVKGVPYTVVALSDVSGPADAIYTLFIGATVAWYLITTVSTAVGTALSQRRLPITSLSVDAIENTPIGLASWRGCLLGCGTSLLLLCLASVTTFGMIDVRGTLARRSSLEIALDCPQRVHQGETFEAVISIHNPTDEPGADLAIDLDGSLELNLFDGVSVVRSVPPYTRHQEAPPGHHFYTFDLTLKPGETRDVTFEFRAERPGEFRGFLFVDVTTDVGRLHTPATTIAFAVVP